MPAIEYKTELGDLCKVRFTIDIQDPEANTQFLDWIFRYARTLPINKKFKQYGRKYYAKREVNKKDDWLLYNVVHAISILYVFLLSYQSNRF